MSKSNKKHRSNGITADMLKEIKATAAKICPLYYKEAMVLLNRSWRTRCVTYSTETKRMKLYTLTSYSTKISVSRITTFQPWLDQKTQLEKARQKSQLSHDNLVIAQERLRQLQEIREQVRKLRQTDTLNAMKQVEQATQQSFDEEMREKENQW